MLKNKTAKLLLATLTTVFAFLLILTPKTTQASTPISGTIDTNATWTEANSPYILNGAITIAEGVTLTIDPDVIVKASYGSSILVNGTLDGLASSTNVIYFTSLQDDSVGGDTNSDATSTAPTGGDWSGIEVSPTGTANLESIIIRYAGQAYPFGTYANIRNQGGILNITNSEIASSSNRGLNHSAGTTTITTTLIRNNASSGIYGNGTGFLSITYIYFSNNGTNASINGLDGLAYITHENSGATGGISISNNITQNTTWKENNIPYILNGAVNIDEGVTLTIDPDVIVKASSGSSMRINGTLDVVANSTSTVYITSLQDDRIMGDSNNDATSSSPAKGDWSGIAVSATGIANINHSSIRYAGHAYPFGTYANIRNEGGILNISNSEIASSSNRGLNHYAGTTTISGSDFVENSVGIYGNDTGSLSVADSYFENNVTNVSVNSSGGLAFTASGNSGTTGGLSMSGTIAQDTTLKQNEIPYILSDQLTVAEDATLTIEPGVVVKSAYGKGLIVEGMLDINATSTNPVYLTSIQDDAIGGDTNSDATSTTPAGGDWSGIDVYSTGTANLESTIIRYAGAYSYPSYTNANIRNQGGVLSISNSEIASSSNRGISHSAGTTTISNSNIINNNSAGVYNSDTGNVVDATHNWWGDASGPYHSTTNASGTGNSISNDVDYSDWLTEPVDIGGTLPVTCTEDCYSNVLFLPGLMGSQLVSYGSAGECWFEFVESDGTVPGSDEDFECLRMTDTETPNTTGVYATEVLAEAGVFDVYKPILDELDIWDSNLGISHEALPYDWRYDYETVVRRTSSTTYGMYVNDDLLPIPDSINPFYLSVTNLASTSKTGKVTVVAHSMGGLVAKEMMIYLQEKGLEDKIDRIILVASPQIGTPHAFGGLLHGHDMALGFGVALEDAEARLLSRNMQSVYNLLPSAEYFSSVAVPVAFMSSTTHVTQEGDPSGESDVNDNSLVNSYGEYLTSTSSQHAFMTDTGRFLPAYDETEAAGIVPSAYVARAQEVHDILDAWTPPAGVEFVTVAGWGLETFVQAKYKRYVTEFCASTCSIIDEDIVMTPATTIEGDETVVAPSALYSSNNANVERWWLDLPEYNQQPFTIDRKHGDIFAVDELRLLVKDTLTGTSGSYTYLHNSTSTLSNPIGNRIQYILHSPLTLGFRDVGGRYTGLKEDGVVVEEIPGASYHRFGEVKFLSIPEKIAGELEMIGTDNGEFTLEVRKVKGASEIVEESAFVAVDTKKGMTVSLPQPGNKRSAFASRALEDLELTIDKHDGKGEQKVKTFEYNAKIYKIRNMEKMEKQSDTASSTGEKNLKEKEVSASEVTSRENSTTTESISKHQESNGATSSATSTPSESESSATFPIGMLPLTMVSILGVELRKFKKGFSLGTLLFCLPFISLFVSYFVFGVDILRETGLTKMWVRHVGSDDLLLYVMLTPLIVLPFSLLYYTSRRTVYLTWLYITVTALIFFIGTIIMYIIDPPGSAGVVSLDGIEFVLLGIVYVGVSLILWLYGAITHFFRKKIK